MAPPAPVSHPHLGPCSYYACLSLCALFFSEYCSNTELAINHIALSPRGASRRALPAHRAPPIGSPRATFGLSDRHMGAIVNPASFPRTSDWGNRALTEVPIIFFSPCAHRVQCCCLPATRRVRSDGTRCIPTETYGSGLIKAQVATGDGSGRTAVILFSATKNISVKSFDNWIIEIFFSCIL